MTELTEEEKRYNEQWMACFDADNYKTIRLLYRDEVIQKYGTANSRYTDEEDAESAFFVAAVKGITVTSVVVGSKRYKRINGKIRRIADWRKDD
ncbi:hypothetical protein [Lacticaseibacillus daqingensis]|uniref:hypothetical protein n=1 Tax=Lacticaseibacillus daqingensis TaxID=2486014 RepID=UPI000F79365F|nr:hypothetical protein [Lacticaseibacillus daqingensis]